MGEYDTSVFCPKCKAQFTYDCFRTPTSCRDKEISCVAACDCYEILYEASTPHLAVKGAAVQLRQYINQAKNEYLRNAVRRENNG